jgi:hypothetical protein
MHSRERVVKALKFENPDRAPRHLWFLPGIAMFRKDELDAVQSRYPDDIAGAPVRYGESIRASGTPNVVGTYTDEWGCVWSVGEPGVIGEVKQPPLADWAALKDYAPPYELLENADFSDVDPFCAETDKFVLTNVANPFERMQYLRGTEALYMDLAYGADEVLRLRDMVHEYSIRNLTMACETDIDAVSIADDWGAQNSLLIAPKLWRELFKPLYADYCRIAHEAGKFVFMHSDGDISSIYADLIEVGIDAINSQLFCMDIEELARQYKGKITFWGEIDRQRILPFGTPDEVRAAVQRVRAALDDGSGGVIAQCEWGLDVPVENVEMVFAEWLA